MGASVGWPKFPFFSCRYVSALALSLLIFLGADQIQAASEVLVGAGDIAGCESDNKGQATAQLLDKIGGTVFTAGDNAYPKGAAQSFSDCYGPSWGRHKQRTRPAPGNHDYQSRQAEPYFKYFGANAGPAGRGFYSYDLGAWHILSLNSNVNAAHWGKEQEDWLRQDLAKNPSACKLAYWHHPYFSSGKRHGDDPRLRNLFTILYHQAVDLVVSGHDHIYERFGPQDPDRRADRRGVRQFIVGTGGGSLYEFGPIKTNSEAHNNRSHGVIKFTLRDQSYDWEFIPIAGQNFTDRGSAACHGAALKTK
jgi:hypothetical protein